MSQINIPKRLRELIDSPGLASLGADARSGTLTVGMLTTQVQAVCEENQIEGESQQLVLCTLLLWHDHLDAAHTIAQAIEGPDGSLLHGIMHRREPDYSNAKYWFRHAGRHACYPRLAAAILQMSPAVSPALLAKIVPGGKWDPMAFVDACAEVARSPVESDHRKVLQEIQRLECTALLAGF